MFSFLYLRVSSGFRIKSFLRLNSTKMTCTRKNFPREFCLESYECVGFDLDHTLCRYKLKPLFHLIYKTLASFLIEKHNYPESLLQLSEDDFKFAQKGIVLDKQRGNFLKLDCSYKIVKACHGTHSLCADDICKIYGPNYTWEESKGIPEKLVLRTAMQEPFYVFKDYFVTPGVIICAKLVDIIDEKGHQGPYSFWNQYLEGLYYMYDRSNFKNNSGKFFPALKSNPCLYIQPCSDNLKKWLMNMRKDKVSFLLTSANHDSAEFVAEQSLGKDWKKYFDIIITFAKKPGFFWKNKPFCLVKEDTETVGVKLSETRPHSVYSQGNFKELQEACVRLSKCKNPKIAYFGDSLIEDVFAASEIGGCDTVAIVEEMLAEGRMDLPDLRVDSALLSSDFWGSFFSNDKTDGDPEGNVSLWGHFLSQHSKLAIPHLDSIADLEVTEKIVSLENDGPISGYCSGIPKTLSC